MLKSLTKLFGSRPQGNSAGDDGTKRKDDYVIIVCQRNDTRRLEIQGVDPSLANMLGFSEEELKKTTLNTILPAHINELIADYLEYNPQGNDLSSVLSKVREFHLVARNKRNISLSLRILPTTSMDGNPTFCLIFRQASLQKVLDSGRDEMYHALKKNLASEGGILGREALMKDLRIVISHLGKAAGRASVALIAIRDLSDIERKYGGAVQEKVLREIALLCKGNFRDDDIIAGIGPSKIAIVLLEAGPESSVIPLNRLRWKINAHEIEAAGEKFNISAAISCTEVLAEDKPEAVISRCERAIIGDEIPGVTVIG